MEIDLSTLSETQKKFYVQLLAQSNLEFTKKENQFVAHFKIDNNQIQNNQGILLDISNTKSQNQKNKNNTPQPKSKKNLGKVVKIGSMTLF